MKMKCDCSYTILTWDFQSENDVDISAAIHKNLFLLFKWFQMKWPLKRSIRRIDSTAGGSSDTEIERKKKNTSVKGSSGLIQKKMECRKT